MLPLSPICTHAHPHPLVSRPKHTHHSISPPPCRIENAWKVYSMYGYHGGHVGHVGKKEICVDAVHPMQERDHAYLGVI
jgi:hypothetical protein